MRPWFPGAGTKNKTCTIGVGKVLCASKSKSKPNKKAAVFLGNAFLVFQTEAGKIAVWALLETVCPKKSG
jgi:hypothetical protein